MSTDKNEEDKVGSNKLKLWFLEEFSPKKLSLAVECPYRFVDSVASNGSISPWYLTLRLVLALLWIVLIILDVIFETREYYSEEYIFWFLYATNWAMLSLCLYFLVSAINTTRYFIRQRNGYLEPEVSENSSSSFDAFTSLHFLLYSITCNSNLVVSAAYWFSDFHLNKSTHDNSILAQVKHSINSVIIISDLIIVSIPIHLPHIVFPLLMSFLYSFFSFAVYDFIFPEDGSNDYLYITLNWNRNITNSLLTCVAVILMVFPAQVVLYLIFKIKTMFWEKVLDQKGSESHLFKASSFYG